MKKANENVLIVDDELDICILLSSVLKSLGYNAEYAGSIKQGIEKVEQSKPSILFLDINLPDGKGFDLIPAIKEKEIQAKIILISANEKEEYKVLSEKYGVSYFMEKPFGKSDIIEALSEVA